MRLAYTVALHRCGAGLLLLLAIFAGGAGCAKNDYTVTRGMAREGYAIWYPAESGIEPGQIWLYDGTLRAKFADRPANMPVSDPQPANLSIEGLNDVTDTLSSQFTDTTISKAGPFAAELNAGTVTNGTFRLPPIESVSIATGRPLLATAAAQYGTGYAKALEMVRDGNPGLVLIASVVRVPRMDYTLRCEDPFKLITRLPGIRDMIHARLDAKVLNEHDVLVSVTPITGMLTIGVTPIRGDRILLSTQDARAALGHDLGLAQRQSYALRTPVPTTVLAISGPIIAATDAPGTVLIKYHDATTPAPPTTQSASGGRVVMPGSQSPASRPSRPKY